MRVYNLSWPTFSPLKAKIQRRSARVCILRLPTAGEIYRAQEANRRMKDKAAHACHALCRARIVEEMQRRKGTATAEHLKFVLSVIDGPRFAKDSSPSRSQT